jgi:hypothetical protein
LIDTILEVKGYGLNYHEETKYRMNYIQNTTFR